MATGYTFNGKVSGDNSGISVSAAGDVTGDGIDDLIIGAYLADPNGTGSAGESYLISGADLAALDNATASGGTAGDGIIELADVAAIGTSYQFNGIDANDQSGFSVSGAGDVTGDGIDDLIIGARGADPNGKSVAGESYLISGADLAALDNATANGGTAGDGIIELADVAATGTSYQFNGIDGADQSGYSVSAAGDVTGDGIDDLIIGAYLADPNGAFNAGESYLISGADLAALDNATANGGTAGDGIIELADVATIGTSYQFNAIASGDQSGFSVAAAGDVTGDGIDDLIIGAFGADPNGKSVAGESYLISGADLAALDNATANGGTAGDGIIELADVAATGTSYQFNGIDASDQSGYSVSAAGDVTGDGIDDLIIGALEADPNGKSIAGESYLISGADLPALDNVTANRGTAGDGIIELADVAATGTSYQFNGIASGDQSGFSVSGAGDVTGDGIDDLIIGAPGADPNGKSIAGESYLISGADLAALDNATANGGTAGDGIIELADVAATGTSYQFNGIDANDFSGTSVSAAGDVTGDGIDDLIIVAYGADPKGQINAGESYLISGADLAVMDARDGKVDGVIDLSNVNCFVGGTLIATPAGEVAVEVLGPGDMVLTDDGRVVPVRFNLRQAVAMHRLRVPEKVTPVRMRAGGLGGALPHTDLVVTADHGMIVDGLVINASALVNGGSIDWVPLAELPEVITYYHIETEAHDVILANGAPSETFVDVAGRMGFDNHGDYLKLYGVERILPEMDRPRITAQRLLPEAIKTRLGIGAGMLELETCLSA